MTALALVNPIGQFFDLDGSPLQGGSMYFGTVNLNPITAPVTVYWDAAATQPASQPVRTLNGYPVRNGTAAAVYAVGNVSMLVLNGAGQQVLYARSSADIGGAASVQIALDAFAADLASTTDVAKGPGLIGYDSLLDHGSGKTVGAALAGAGRILQGADPTGSVDATALFKALADKCIPLGEKQVWPAGTYKVSGPITSSSYAAGSLHIHCVGDVTIEVDAASTAFTTLISCYTTAINSASISGGRLILNLNSKCSNGLYLRHAGGQGGTVNLGPVTVNDAKENDGAATAENQGILAFGRYMSVIMESPIVDGVDRTNAAGICKGISVSELDGQCEIRSPYVARVMAGPGTVDADGISIFGYQSGAGVYDWRNSYAQIIDPVVEDCQGRSIKLQLHDVALWRPRIYRKMVVSLSVPDIDFQLGGDVQVIAPFWEIRKNGGTSPLGAFYYPLAWQQNCTDRINRCVVSQGTFRSEVAVQYFVAVIPGATALSGSLDLNGMEFISAAGLGSIIGPAAIVSISAAHIAASTGDTHLNVRNCRGNITGYPWIGYSSAPSATNAKFSWSVTNNENLGAVNSSTLPCTNISGTKITSFKAFMCRDNMATSDYLGAMVFDFQTLPVGCRFHYDIATSTDANAPGAMSGSGVAFVEVLGQYSATAGYRTIRVTHADANAANTVFYTQTGTWGTIK